LSIFQREPKTIDDCVRFGLEYEAFTVDQKRLNNPKQGLRMVCETDDSGKNDLIERIATDVCWGAVLVSSIQKFPSFWNPTCLSDCAS
jgi:hypothetical protein